LRLDVQLDHRRHAADEDTLVGFQPDGAVGAGFTRCDLERLGQGVQERIAAGRAAASQAHTGPPRGRQQRPLLAREAGQQWSQVAAQVIYEEFYELRAWLQYIVAKRPRVVQKLGWVGPA
jgi:hypothetical protein